MPRTRAPKSEPDGLGGARERYFRSLIENSTEIITIVDSAGNVKYESPSLTRVLGYTPEELVGRNPFTHMHPDDRQRVYAEFQRGVEDPAYTTVVQYRFRHRDGGWRILESRGRNLLADPDVAGFVVNTTDVTEIRKAEAALRVSEEQLRQAQRMEAVGRLAGGIAHDYNNVLTAIGGTSELLLEELPEGHPMRQDVLEIQRGVQRAASLTCQLLTFSRRQVVKPRVLCLNDVVAETDRMLRRLIGEDVVVRTSLQPDLPPVHADAGQIDQVLMNLAINARDAMPVGGTIGIRTSAETLHEPRPTQFGTIPPGLYVKLSVSDTGTGIAPDVLPFIFDPFFTTKEVGRGTGLGLSTVYGIVQQAHGHLAVDTRPGRGTRIEIFLPPTEESEREPPPPPREQRSRGSETILVAEDEPVVRGLVRRVLQRDGYTVLDAAGGTEALRLAETHPGRLDLVLTDVVMPGFSGRQLGERLRGLFPHLPIVYMSGYTEDAIVQHGIRNHEVEFLEKPFTPDGLLRKVRDVLDRA